MKDNTKKVAAAGSLAAVVLGGTLVLGIATSASAATPDPTASASASTGSSSSATPAPDPSSSSASPSESTENPATEAAEGANGAHDPSKGGHVGANGVTEQLLTGTTADQVQAAVLAANSGATIERMENDAEGATYEAHIVKADGTKATVKLDASFAITGTETGH
ncbi:hypothetical protein [Microbacterium sp. CJ88]|uniref:hypothetical protein n=1 Tax=Microbacterium sp. CJ88 TaxID=3445672 RepID=UPI003F65DF88